MGAWTMIARAVSVALAAYLSTGCVSLSALPDRPHSAARAVGAKTSLGALAAVVHGQPADRTASRFGLLPDGREAFEARLALIERATDSIDAQYFSIADDSAGSQFISALRRAALRGVRVRLLVDDLHAAAQTDALATLAAHDGVEVRLWNPLPARTGSVARRVLLSLHEFDRINRRMHNKLLIADGAFAISGGRNIGDAYFDRGGYTNFIDLDVLAVGPVIAELAAAFDRYWNCELAFPIGVLVAPPRAAGAVGPTATASGDADEFLAGIASGRIRLEPAKAALVADDPRKAFGAARSSTVADAHLALLASAQINISLATPYFIPAVHGIRAMTSLRARDVTISVLTNSLASTDEPLVHFAYARYRRPLLDAGVALHELMPAHGELEHYKGASLGRLHSKLAVVDNARLFVGSMNMDPRSASLNTELGLIIESAPLAARATALLLDHTQHRSYRLHQEGQQLRWRYPTEDGVGEQRAERRNAAMPPLLLRWLAKWLGEGFL